ncbi:MAG: electron transfer flavoprotein subunit beta/FixA family protein [Bacteroidetes bacterium]|nr:electron transfer flavoprotein subunit beta/FixA family protein [Bacteroidota bacterium]
MKILLCASKTPDTTTKIVFSADKKSIDNSGVTYILNPYDDHGLAKAMVIKEKTGASLTVIHVGDASAEAVLRKALSIGADDCIRVNLEPNDSYTVAAEIAAAIKGENYDLIITGRESIDFNGSQVCDLLGEMLGIPSIAFVSNLELDGNAATLKRFIDGGEETLSVNLPIVISATKELAEPLIPNMRGIMCARSNPIKVVEPSANTNAVTLVTFEAPASKQSCIMIDPANAEELIDMLHNK